MDPEEKALFRIAPSCFVRTRNQLAEALKDQGLKAESRRIRSLRRPSLALWATNQLSDLEPSNLQAYLIAFVRAQDYLRKSKVSSAHQALAITAARQARHLVDRLCESAALHLQTSLRDGAKPATKTVGQIATNLRAAPTSHEERKQLLSGTLRRDLMEPGFDVLLSPDG